VSQGKGAISYVPLVAVQQANVSILAIDGIAPGVRALQQGAYPFWSVEHFYTGGAGSAQTQSFLSFVTSAQEEAILPQFSAVPLDALPASVVTSHLPGPQV
jgi:ABC-type phosphate transport system substrate-binding protein